MGIMPDESFREIYIKSHPELDTITKEDIRNGTIRVGMTTEQVKASWGYPDEIHEDDEDRTIMFIYKDSAPGTIWGDKRDIYLTFKKESLLKGTESYLLGWFPPDIKYGVINVEEEEPLIDWEEVHEKTQ